MSLPNLLYFYRRRLRARIVQELLALVGIAVGVGLLFAVQVSNSSLRSSVVKVKEGLIGNATLEVSSRSLQGFDESLTDRVKDVDGVNAAAPSLNAPLNLVGPRGEAAVTMLAADARLARMGGTLLRHYATGRLLRTRALVLTGEVAAKLGVRTGGRVTVQAGSAAVRMPVGAVFDENDVGSLSKSPIAMLPLDHAQTLLGDEGRVTQVFVSTAPKMAGRVANGLRSVSGPGLDVEPAGHDRVLFDQLAETTDRSSSLFAAISAMVGFLFAFNAMQLIASDRRALIAELRLSGFRGRTVVSVLAVDGLVLGLMGSAVGLMLGEALSRAVFEPAPGFLAFAFPVGTARSVGPWAVIVASSCGVVAALAATLAPLLGVWRRTSIDDVGDGRLSRQRASRIGNSVALGVLALALATVSVLILRWTPQLALIGMATLILSMLLVLPAALRGALSLSDRGRRVLRSAVPVIAVGELRAAGSRSVALTTVVAVAVLGSTAIEGAHADLEAGLDRAAHDLNANTGLWVTARGATNHLTTTPFPLAALRGMERIPGVREVRPYRSEFLDMNDRRVWVVAPSAHAPPSVPVSQIIEGDPDRARERLRQGGWLLLSEALASELGVGVGRSFVFESPRPLPMRVAGITTNLGWAGGAVIMSADDHKRAWGTDDVSAVHVIADAGNEARVRTAVESWLGRSSPLEVLSDLERESRFRQATRDGLTRLTQIATLVLLGAALAMAAAMGGMIWQRRRGLAALKLEGIDAHRVWRALMLETALITTIGATVGALYGLAGQQLLDRALAAVTGFPVEASVGAGVALMSTGVVLAVAVAIATVPGFVAARTSVEVAFEE